MIAGLKLIQFFTEKIIHLNFSKQYDLSSTFLRFQEYYESPEFRNKIFTLKEYKQWYIKQNGEFSYYTDWGGFNIPSKILKPFYKNKFKNLSKREKDFLHLFSNKRGKFYIIGTYGNDLDNLECLKHELAHAFYYIDDEYKKSVNKLCKSFTKANIAYYALLKVGYCKHVLMDELNAYTATGERIFGVEDSNFYKFNEYIQFKKATKALFDEKYNDLIENYECSCIIENSK